MTPDSAPSAPKPLLLTRRAATADLPGLTPLLSSAGIAGHVSAELVAEGSVLLLDDMGGPAGQPPLGALALGLDPLLRRALLLGVAIGPGSRRHGFGRRLLADSATWLQAQGYEQVVTRAGPGSPEAVFLVACGFRPIQEAEGLVHGYPRPVPAGAAGEGYALGRDL